MGLFLALVGRSVLVTQRLLPVGQRGEGQVGSRRRKESCWVFWAGGRRARPAYPSPGWGWVPQGGQFQGVSAFHFLSAT